MFNSFDKHAYRILVALALITIGSGTIIFHFVEKISYLDAYYFSVVTLATVGYGDITPHTDLGKVITTFYILIGVGIITTFISATARRRAERRQERRDKKDKTTD
ncbi:MAG TPA: potassium channel family protein [Methylomirabilota bacterium]|nr:potassium channel family protein [Methylomirabilota bacterium]